jgi:hypothetical protein
VSQAAARSEIEECRRMPLWAPVLHAPATTFKNSEKRTSSAPRRWDEAIATDSHAPTSTSSRPSSETSSQNQRCAYEQSTSPARSTSASSLGWTALTTLRG